MSSSVAIIIPNNYMEKKYVPKHQQLWKPPDTLKQLHVSMDLVLPSDSPVLVEPGNWKKPQPVKIGDQPNPQPCMFNIITNEKWVTRNTGWWYTYPSEKYQSQLG